MNLTTTIAGIKLEHPIMNGAGWGCKTLEEVEALAGKPVSAIVVGSVTENQRDGNQAETYFYDHERGESLNTLGLPGPGKNYYQRNLPRMVHIAHSNRKPLILSVVAVKEGPAEYARLTQTAHEGGADGVEVNMACPNVWDGGKQKHMPSFDPSEADAILREIAGLGLPSHFFLSVKLSPFSDPMQLAEVAAIIKRHSERGLVKAITVCNTFPNAIAFLPDGKRAITSPQAKNGRAGLAGPAFKAIALGQVDQWREQLPTLPIIGVGGITTGRDVWEFLSVGANAVQITTAHVQQKDPFTRILTEFVGITDQEAARA